MIKRCKCCGQKFEVTKGGITICSDCKAAEGKYDEIYRAKIREQKKLKNIRKEKVKEIEPDRSKCATCLYRMHVSENERTWRCGYCYYTGHKRPCEISKKCTVYKRYTNSEKKQLLCLMKTL